MYNFQTVFWLDLVEPRLDPLKKSAAIVLKQKELWHFRVILLGGFVYVYKLLTLEKASYLTVFILHIHCYMYSLC